MSQKQSLRLTERERFSFYLRTGRMLEIEPDTLETKFNPYHDPENGRFTFAPGGPHSRRSVITSWGKYKPKIVQSDKPQTISGSRLDVPIPPATPIDGVSIEGRQDGPDIIVTAPKQEKRSYALSSPRINVAPIIAKVLEAAAAAFKRRTGKTMIVTSATRHPHSQADAMYEKFKAGASGSDYKNQAALREIKTAYVAGRQSGKTKEQIVAEMEKIIVRQTEAGIYISRHLSGRAVDIRNWDLSPSEKEAMKDAVRDVGGKVHSEGRPPHLHVQF